MLGAPRCASQERFLTPGRGSQRQTATSRAACGGCSSLREANQGTAVLDGVGRIWKDSAGACSDGGRGRGRGR